MSARPTRRTSFRNACSQRPLPEQAAGIGASLAFGAVFLGVVALSIKFSVVWLAIVATPVFVVGCLWASERYVQRGEPVSWFVGRRAAVALHMLGWRRVPYRDVLAVESTDQDAVIVTADDRIPLGEHTVDRDELAALLCQRAGVAAQAPAPPTARPDDDGPDVVIPPETVAAWLGLSPGETLRVAERLNGYVWSMLAILVALIVALVVFSSRYGMGGPMALAALVAGVAGLKAYVVSRVQSGRVVEVHASGEALEVLAAGRRRRVAWGSLRSLTPLMEHTLQVAATGGDLRLGVLLDKKRLLPAIEQAIAARRAGAALPKVDGDAVPQGAISPTVDAANEAAISRSTR